MSQNTKTRRDFLQKILPVNQESASETTQAIKPFEDRLSEFTLQGGLEPYNGVWGREQAAHLLRRVTFGIKRSQLESLFYAGNASKAVDFVLNIPNTAPAPPINNYNNEDFKDPDIAFGSTWVNAKRNNDAEGYRIDSWRGWWLERMINGPANIEEKMILFWSNHFATRTDASFSGQATYRYFNTLRKYALGDFKAMTRDITLEPSMLFFLNGLLNGKEAPDENYSRELQELFTVGKDNPDHYTEDDVVEAAKVLTGWRLDYETNKVFLDLAEHDQGDKKFSAFYGNTVIKGGTDAERELKELIDMIFKKEEVAEHICRKIYRFFVFYRIDDTVEEKIIKPLAIIFRKNNYQVKPVMEALLKSAHFFDAYNKASYIKNPLDLMMGVIRNFEITVKAPKPFDQFQILQYLGYWAGGMQMYPGDPPNVAGWQAYRQSPGYYRMWINADTLRNRNIYTDIMAQWRFESENYEIKIDHIAFAQQLPRPDDPNRLIEDLLNVLLPVPVSDGKKKHMKNILLSNQAQDYYWTIAWKNYQANPRDKGAFDTVWYRLGALNKYIMNLPEYQLI
jgi:uncharacterized protein (DUF1800 family)